MNKAIFASLLLATVVVANPGLLTSDDESTGELRQTQTRALNVYPETPLYSDNYFFR